MSGTGRRGSRRAAPRKDIGDDPRIEDIRVKIVARRLPAGAAALARAVRLAARAAAGAVRLELAELSIAIVGDQRMRRLNREFHATDETTDVLAFGYSDPGEPLDGEVIVCAPVARRQAKARGLPFRSELLLYVVHGVLHLGGEDDHERAAARRMRRREREVLAGLGVRLPADHLEIWKS
jgi:probable rRNA maturation factor